MYICIYAYIYITPWCHFKVNQKEHHHFFDTIFKTFLYISVHFHIFTYSAPAAIYKVDEFFKKLQSTNGKKIDQHINEVIYRYEEHSI